MDAKWGRFGSTLSDLWVFFIPPILNAVVLLIVFPGVPRLIWDVVKVLLIKLREVAPQAGSTFSSIPSILKEFPVNSSLITALSSSAFSAILSAVITLAILIFVLHKVVLVSSRLLFGRLDIKEEELRNHPIAGASVEYVEAYLPKEEFYDSFIRKWEYARSVNDMQENMGIYRDRREKITLAIEQNKAYAAYASAYLVMSAVSIVLNKSAIPMLIAIFTLSLFLLFARRYTQLCAALASIDFHTFLAIVKFGNEPTKRDIDIGHVPAMVIRNPPTFLRYVSLMKGNIGETVVDLFNGSKSSVIYSVRILDELSQKLAIYFKGH